MPDMLGLRGDTYAVALAECETAGFHLKFHTFSGIEKSDFLADMSLSVPIRAGAGRNHHHAKFDAAPGIGSEQFVDHIGFILSADSLAGIGSNYGLIFFLLFKKVIERGIESAGKGTQRIDGWIYLAILNLAEHRSGDAGGR